MESSLELMPAPASVKSGSAQFDAALRTVWGRWLIPSLCDFFVIALTLRLFSIGEGWKGLLMDGDTGWHIRTGQWILAHGQVPYRDLFSFSKPEATWFAWEWLTDALYAFLFSWSGLKGIVLFSGLVIAFSAVVLFRHMLARRANVFPALIITLLYIGASSIHFHARPHIVTLLLMAGSLWILERDRECPGRLVWTLPGVAVVWTNLHGGFLALIACVGLIAGGTLLEELIASERNWRRVRRYWILLAACAAASLLNPYGIELHRHVVEYLRSDWIMNGVDEFQSPRFRSESMFQYELLLFLGLITSSFLLVRKQIASALLILYFAHASLSAVRHVPIYIIVAAPAIALELTRWWDKAVAGRAKSSILTILDQISTDLTKGFRRTTVWTGALIVALAIIDKPIAWPTDFFARSFPGKMVDRFGDRLADARVLTSDQWADYLIYRSYPKQKVFFDGRSDFYGKALGKEYLALMSAEWKWEGLMDKYGFELVLAPMDWPLGTVLKNRSDWRLVADDGKAILFERVDAARPESRRLVNGQVGLMKRTETAESTRRDPKE